jgi:hypothetical protein
VARQLRAANEGFVGDFGRDVHAAVLRAVEPEAATEIRIAVEALVDLVESSLDIDVVDWADPHAGGPNAVRKCAVADVAARQCLRIAAQRVVHVAAV